MRSLHLSVHKLPMGQWQDEPRIWLRISLMLEDMVAEALDVDLRESSAKTGGTMVFRAERCCVWCGLGEKAKSRATTIRIAGARCCKVACEDCEQTRLRLCKQVRKQALSVGSQQLASVLGLKCKTSSRRFLAIAIVVVVLSCISISPIQIAACLCRRI